MSAVVSFMLVVLHLMSGIPVNSEMALPRSASSGLSECIVTDARVRYRERCACACAQDETCLCGVWEEHWSATVQGVQWRHHPTLSMRNLPATKCMAPILHKQNLLFQAQCKGVLDRYVEFDAVILLLDVLLLHVQSYRHLIFNHGISNEVLWIHSCHLCCPIASIPTTSRTSVWYQSLDTLAVRGLHESPFWRNYDIT